MVRKLVWTKKAFKEWENILAFWFKRSGNKKYSRKLNNKIRIIFKNIRNNNNIGKKTEIENIRLMICSHYKIFYKIDDAVIYIISIFDSRRNPNDIKV